MKQLYIVGAGGFGREVFAWCSQHPDCGRQWDIAGFLDDARGALEGYAYPRPVLGGIRDWRPSADALFVCAIGRPAQKKPVCEALRDRGATFLTIVHPSVVLGSNVRLGTGVVVCPGVMLTSDVELGDFVMVNCGASAGHDVHVGAYSTVSAHCDLTGGVRLGEGVFCGSHASVFPGRTVDDWAVVGAGAIVVTHVAARTTVVGNPATRLVT
ncbi:MAG: acetyltransferase [Acidobacteriota bacterium]|nr:acetyltransferase [Acidobacteriota bacterium]